MDKDSRQWLAALSYPFWPVGLITALVVEDKDKTLHYHARQGAVFGILLTVAWIILNAVLRFVFWWLLDIIGLALLIIAIIYAVKAYKGEMFKVPIVYDVMKKVWKN